MQKVEVHRGWLEQAGGIPPVCLRTGEPTNGLVRKRNIVTAPGWVAIFVLFGALPYIIARSAVGDKVTLQLPISPACRNKSRIYSLVALVVCIASVVPIGGGLGGSSTMVLLGLAVFCGGIGLAIWNRLTHNIGIKMSHKNPTVTLKRIHPDAATALRDRVASALATRPPAPQGPAVWSPPAGSVPGAFFG
jgi:hypothetical protein